jgi:poly-gamma-glutamate capsule biosynthesis protein CapA/YwtB (metallophosphatase superfamily)
MITHAGVENIKFPIKEWRDRYKRFCDVGVDVVIGHHPHVPQGYEKQNKSMIFYSLGNFILILQVMKIKVMIVIVLF